jgi:hypothetical protein
VVISLERHDRGADVLGRAEGNILGALFGLASRVLRGTSPGHVHKGVRPGTWENPEISAVKSRLGSGRPIVQAHSRGRPHPVGAKKRA